MSIERTAHMSDHLPFMELMFVDHEDQASPAVLASGVKWEDGNWTLRVSKARKKIRLDTTTTQI